MNRKVLLIGLRATGHLHLGHYYLLQQVENFLKKTKNKYELFFLIADQHAIINSTSKKISINIKKNTMLIIKSLVSLGVSTKQIIISSYLNCLNQTSWFLSEFIKLNEILFIPNIKFNKTKENYTRMSKLFYAILMSTEILLCCTSHLILGKDQIPNLNVTKKIFKRIAKHIDISMPSVDFCKVLIGTDGQSKMSKSLDNVVSIFENKEMIKKKILKILSSSTDFWKEEIENSTVYKIFSFLFEKELKLLHKNKGTHFDSKIFVFKQLLEYFEVYRKNFENINDEKELILFKKVRRNTILWNRQKSKKIYKKVREIFQI